MMIAVPSYICDTQFKLNIFIYFYVLQIKFSKERKKDMKQQVPRLAWVQQTSHKCTDSLLLRIKLPPPVISQGTSSWPASLLTTPLVPEEVTQEAVNS